jgi:acetyl-CoA acetyltransferase family protein
LSGIHAVDLAAHVLAAIVERNDLDPSLVDDVLFGCVTQTGEQGANVARNAALAAGFPEEVVGVTIDRQCGSSQQAAHFAAQGVIAGAYDIVIAGGVESMSRVPMGSALSAEDDYGRRLGERYARAGGFVPMSQGNAAELIAERWSLSRDDLDAFADRSHQRAATATSAGAFEAEIVPVPLPEGGSCSADEGIRPHSNVEALAALRPVFRENGVVTAGNSSQITDGAAALLIMGEERAAQLGLRARARFHTFALAGVDPIMMLTAPIPATHHVLARSGLSLSDIDVIEINEAFASVVLAWERELHPDMDRVNVNGGAIALGHPLGASGAKLLATLLNQMERSSSRFGLLTMCEGGGMANATLIERLG